MQKTIFLFLIITSSLFSTPTWFNDRMYISQDQTYYGYGEGRNDKSARLEAMREISEQISSSVNSTIQIQTNSTNEYVSQNIDSSAYLTSSKALKDVKIIKHAKSDGSVYIVMKYTYDTPIWFETRSYDAPLFSLIGYGTGKSMKEATLEAQQDISSQINTNIQSSLDISVIEKDNISSSEVKSKISSSSQSILKNAKYLNSEKVGNNFFVALKLQKIPTLTCTKQQNTFLEHIELIKKANRLTSCKYDYGLERVNKHWHLYADGWSQKLNTTQFDSFFTSANTSTLSIDSEYSSYQVDDIFTLNVHSKKDGYLSIIAIYENGKTGVMLENQAINAYQNITFPSPNSGLELVAGLNEQNKATKDLYFAFVSPKKIDLAKFEMLGNELLGEQEYNFHKIINLCSKYDFASTLIRTTPKNRIKRFQHVAKIQDNSSSWFFSDELKNRVDDLPFHEKEKNKWAFIISIEDYEFSDTIKYAQNSGELFKMLASKKLNVPDEQIVFLNGNDAGAQNIINNLNMLKSKVKQGDSIYFYFVGQGVPSPSEKNEPYLLAYDKSVGSFAKEKNLQLANIYNTLASSKASHIYMFLDTTFSGATDGVSVFKGVAAPKLRPKKLKIDNTKISVMIAGQNTEFANKYSDKRHRMFSYFLIDGILNQNIQNMEHLYEYTKTQTNKKSFELGDEYIQTPIMHGNKSLKL